MSVTVHTQAELDKALADKAAVIYIESEAWLYLPSAGTGSSHVEAWGSSHVEARGSSHVVARGSSHVEARDSSHVEARGSSHVEAWDSSHVEATKYVGIHLHSQRVTLDGNGQVIDLTEINLDDPAQWCEFHGVTVDDGIAYLYKAVRPDWTTGRGVDYSPGSTPEAPDWDTTRECGHGLHFCDHPIRSLDFLGQVEGARFLKCGVRLDEMVTLGDKVKARRVVVACVEVDRYGQVVSA